MYRAGHGFRIGHVIGAGILLSLTVIAVGALLPVANVSACVDEDGGEDDGGSYRSPAKIFGPSLAFACIDFPEEGDPDQEAPENTSPPYITPSVGVTVGDVLTCRPGSWTDSPDSYTYRWVRNGTVIAGAISATYTTVNDDSWWPISCEVRATNENGSSVWERSADVEVQAQPEEDQPEEDPPASDLPVNTVAPSITPSSPMVGDVLNCYRGVWDTDEDQTSYSYRWYRNGGSISGATSTTYTAVDADAEQQISCLVTATNEDGSTRASSSAVIVMDATLPENTESPTVSPSDPLVGDTVSCEPGQWLYMDSGSYSYNWYSGFTGNYAYRASGQTITITDDDADSYLYCSVDAQNATGIVVVDSDVVVPRFATSPTNVEQPSLSQSKPVVGDTLTCDKGTWTATNGLSDYHYVWKRGSRSILSPDAADSDYTITKVDTFRTIKCEVTAENGTGTSAVATSDDVRVMPAEGTGK